MVLLRVKVSEDDQFLFRTTCVGSVDATRSELTQIYNLRQKLRRLQLEGEELAEYGVAKRPDEHGIDTYSTEPIEEGEHYKMDPSGKRDGNGCAPTAKRTLLKTLNDGLELVHKRRVEERHEQTRAELMEAVDLVRGAVMIGYPMGLPEWDPVRLLIENRDDASLSVANRSLTALLQYGYEEGEMALWFAGKEMRNGESLRAYLGKNENTTATVRLTAANQGAPSREPVIDEATHKGMLAWSYKKQEEQKVRRRVKFLQTTSSQALTENQEDVYLESEWASTKSLKQHLNGTRHIRI